MKLNKPMGVLCWLLSLCLVLPARAASPSAYAEDFAQFFAVVEGEYAALPLKRQQIGVDPFSSRLRTRDFYQDISQYSDHNEVWWVV